MGCEKILQAIRRFWPRQEYNTADYTEYILSRRLIKERELDVTLTTGDADYCGTDLEVRVGEAGDELFHFIIDEDGNRQIIIHAQKYDYRLDLSTLEALIVSAKEKVICVYGRAGFLDEEGNEKHDT